VIERRKSTNTIADMAKWIVLACAIIAEVTASLSLEAALTEPTLYIVVVVGFFAAFLCLAFVLRRGMALGVAYGIWGAAGVAATAVASTWLYGDPFTPLMTAGMVLIIAGVLVVELGSQRARCAQESVEADS
jgi:small multidrug resistance pump